MRHLLNDIALSPAGDLFLTDSDTGEVLKLRADAPEGTPFEVLVPPGKPEVLEAYHPSFQLPTTGVLVGEELYFIANSQLRSLGTDGKYLPAEQLQPVSILRVSVAR